MDLHKQGCDFVLLPVGNDFDVDRKDIVCHWIDLPMALLCPSNHWSDGMNPEAFTWEGLIDNNDQMLLLAAHPSRIACHAELSGFVRLSRPENPPRWHHRP